MDDNKELNAKKPAQLSDEQMKDVNGGRSLFQLQKDRFFAKELQKDTIAKYMLFLVEDSTSKSEFIASARRRKSPSYFAERVSRMSDGELGAIYNNPHFFCG